MAIDLGSVNLSFGSPREEEDTRPGFLGTMLSEIGKDFKGAGRTAAALAFSPLDFLGAEVPVSFSDLTRRDITGSLMIASGFVGGAIAQGVRGARVGAGFAKSLPLVGNKAAQEAAREAAKRMGFLQNMAVVGASEAAAGAAFGALKPLEQGEARLEEVLKESALFGSFGAAGGVIASAFRSTVGAQLAIVKTQAAAARSQQGLIRTEATQKLKEVAGLKFHNPDTGVEGILRRIPDGNVLFETPSETLQYSDFSSALFQTIENGYTENLGMAKSQLSRQAVEGLEVDVDDLLQEGVLRPEGDELFTLTESLDLKNYTGVRAALDEVSDADAIASSLQIENLVEHRNSLGELDPKKIAEIAQSVEKIVPKRVFNELAATFSVDKTGATFLRESMRRGVLSVQNFADGITLKDWLTEFNITKQSLGDVTFVANASYDASFLVKALTTNGVVKLHPELAPWMKLIDDRSVEHELGASAWSEMTQALKTELPKEKLSAAYKLISETQSIEGVGASRTAAANAALKSGDRELFETVEKVYNIFNSHKLRRVAKGMSGTTRANAADTAVAREYISRMIFDQENFVDFDSFSLEVDIANFKGAMRGLTQEQKVAVRELLDSASLEPFRSAPPPPGFKVKIGDSDLGTFSSLDTALQEVALSSAKGTATVLPLQSVDAAAARVISADAIMEQVEKEAKRGTFTLTDDMRNRIRKEGLEAVLGEDLDAFRRQGALEESFLGLSEDPFNALDYYGLQQESALANHGLDKATEDFLREFVPEEKGVLRAFIRDKTAIMQGRPTHSEQMIDNFFRRFAPEFNIFKLKKFSQSVRRYQSVMKLGGAWSGLVNSTQFLVNGGTVLGAKYAAKGLQTVMSKTERERFAKLLADNKKSLGFHGSLSAEGLLAFEEQIGPMVKAAAARWSIGNKREALSAAKEAAENSWLYLFNSAEKFNRFATAAGAYAKALDDTPGISPELALEKALGVVERTQFNYRSSNIPLLMQGPIGSVLFQFKSFFVNQAEFIASLNPQERMRFGAVMIAGGGLSSLLEIPGVDLADAASMIFNDKKLSEALQLSEAQIGADDDIGMLSKAITRFAAYGAPGLAGIDLSNYLGPGSLSDFTRGFLGPSGSDTQAFVEFLGNAMRDTQVTGAPTSSTYNRFIRQVMPSQIRRLETGVGFVSSFAFLDWQRGKGIAQTGEVRNPYSGKLVYKPQNRWRAAAAASIGVPLVEDTSQRVIDDYVQRTTENYRGVRESFRKQIALSFIKGDQAKGNNLLERARASGVGFSPADVRRAVESFSVNAEERRRLRTPSDLREGFLEDFEGILPGN